MNRETVHRPVARALVWLAGLGPSFYLAYGAANAWAGRHAELSSAAFSWEHAIPFWPWTIFPYWSINALYALSPFLARRRHALDRHGLRLLTATLLACTCFVVWPLRFAFGQPPVEGPPALLFNALRSFDQPFNQAPSLHIALTVILWDWYRQFVQGRWARWLLHAWALLIGVSVLTTWQHHVIDIPTGALLGLLCVWLWPLAPVLSMPQAWRCTRDGLRGIVGGLYGAAATLGLVLSLQQGGLALLAIWPVTSLILVAGNYLGFGVRGFQIDRRGRMHWATRWLLAPYRIGAFVNARLWTWPHPASVQVAPGLRLGRLPTSREWQMAGQPHLLSLCAELQLPKEAPQARCLPQLDLIPASATQLRIAAGAIESQRCHARSQGRDVWVCCALGFSRSAAAMAAWLLQYGNCPSLGQAEAQLRAARPQLKLSASCRHALATLHAFPTDHGR